MRLKDRVAVITGSSRGIGAEVARRFAAEGADIVINYKSSRDEAEEVRKAVEGYGRRAVVVQADVARRSDVQKMFKTAFETFGKIEILINNAGVSRPKPFLELTDDDWDEVMASNLKSMFICTQEAFPYLMKNPAGRIVNMSSAAGQYHGPEILNYAVSKAGVISLTKCTARFGAPHNILINAVAPGIILTDMTRDELEQPLGKRIIDMTMLKKPGTVDDVVETILFLASFDQNYITAQDISISGGAYM